MQPVSSYLCIPNSHPLLQLLGTLLPRAQIWVLWRFLIRMQACNVVAVCRES